MAWVIRPKFDASKKFIVRRRMKISGVEVHVGQEVCVDREVAGALSLDKRTAKRMYDSQYLGLPSDYPNTRLQPTVDLPAIPAEVRLDQPTPEDVSTLQARKPITASQALGYSGQQPGKGKGKGKE